MLNVWHRSNLITYMGIATAVTGLCFAAQGKPGIGIICLIVAGICDLFDGVFARRFTRSDWQMAFGVQIDSLADMLSFAALPVAILYSAGLSQWHHLPLLVFYALTASSRLAYFNASTAQENPGGPVTFYQGMPVTYVALILPLVWMLSYLLDPAIFIWVISFTALLVSILFVLDVKTIKPSGAAYGVFTLMALLCGGAIALLELL